MTFNLKNFNIVIQHFVKPFQKCIYCWWSKNLIFKAIFAQVDAIRAPGAKMTEKCEKVLITVKVIDMVLIILLIIFVFFVEKHCTKIVDRLWISTILESLLPWHSKFTTPNSALKVVLVRPV